MTTIPAQELPYGASPVSVRAMVLDTAAEGVRLGQRAERVSDDRLAEWIGEAAGVVTGRTWRVAQLPLDGPAGTLTQVVVDATRKHLVELYAASLLQDVTHPERAAQESPGAPLLDRFWKLLDSLVADVAAALDGGAVPVADGGDLGVGAFPPPLITRDMGF